MKELLSIECSSGAEATHVDDGNVASHKGRARSRGSSCHAWRPRITAPAEMVHRSGKNIWL
eukprot:5241882-Pleurochrysis_carterae.AAC.2